MAEADGSTAVRFDSQTTRAAARAAGLKKYFTGVPCKHGHVAERWVSKRTCVKCTRINGRITDKKRTEKKRLWRREWMRRNQGRARHYNQKSYKKRTATREGVLAIRSSNWPVEPTRPEPANCELCGSPPNHGRKCLVLDHDHDIVVFRGWLCSKCNTGLGLLGDDAASVRRALDYLEGKINAVPTP